MDPALAAYIEAAQKIAATQDLTQDRRGSTRTLSIIFTVIAAVFVALRFLSRSRQGSRYGLDDWLIVAALLFLVGNLVCIIIMVNNGLGLHSGALTLDEAVKLGKILLVNEPFYFMCISLIKVSLLVMFYRIFPIRKVKIRALILGVISIMWMLVLTGVSQGQCNPRKKAWAPWTAGTCIDLKVTFLATSIPNIITDIAILALPLPNVWLLQTNLRLKILLTIIFLLGSFVVFTSIYRFMVYLGYDPNDLPYTLALGCAWNTVELSSGIVSACLPTLGPLVRSVIKGTSRATASASNGIDNNVGIITIGGGGGDHSKGRRSQHFHKLDDDLKYGFIDNLTQNHGDTITTTVTKIENRSDNGSGDEIPLTAIRQ